RLLGPRRAAPRRRLGRSLGPRHARAGDPRGADGEARLRRPHDLRHDVDPEAHHGALRPRAARGRAPPHGRPHERAAVAAARILSSVVLGVIACGSMRSSITAGLPEAIARASAGADRAVSATTSPTQPNAHAHTANTG